MTLQDCWAFPTLLQSAFWQASPDLRMGCKGAIGQAPALSKSLWKQWLQWLKAKAGARIFVIVTFTGAFGLRMGEAVALQAEDMDLQAEIPKLTVTGDTLGNRKSPGEVYIRKQHLAFLRDLFRNGLTVMREKGHKHGKGGKKQIVIKDVYKPPKKGYLFPARKKAKKGHLHYHAVYDHVRREAPKFVEFLRKSGKQWSAEVAKLRPHSGRATLITELMGEGLTTAMSMKYARHAPGSVKVHLRYGRLTLKDVKEACDNIATGSPGGEKWASMTTRQLLNCQAEITAVLKQRNAGQ